ncbi:MAG: sigma factor [Anaerovoracaceae bacterium]
MLISYLAMIGTQHEKSEFVKLYERYSKLMHYAAKRILGDDSLAEEAVQEAFLRIAKNFGKVSDADQSATKKFVLIITENAAKTLYRRESRHISDREYPEDGRSRRSTAGSGGSHSSRSRDLGCRGAYPADAGAAAERAVPACSVWIQLQGDRSAAGYIGVRSQEAGGTCPGRSERMDTEVRS